MNRVGSLYPKARMFLTRSPFCFMSIALKSIFLHRSWFYFLRDPSCSMIFLLLCEENIGTISVEHWNHPIPEPMPLLGINFCIGQVLLLNKQPQKCQQLTTISTYCTLWSTDLKVALLQAGSPFGLFQSEGLCQKARPHSKASSLFTSQTLKSY